MTTSNVSQIETLDKAHLNRINAAAVTLEAATEAFKVVSAAYSVLCEEFGK